MWHESDNTLYQKFDFEDFSEAFSFMVRVAMLAESQNHHPTWKNTYNTVEIWLTTHDKGSQVSEKDWQLAKAIDKLIV